MNASRLALVVATLAAAVACSPAPPSAPAVVQSAGEVLLVTPTAITVRHDPIPEHSLGETIRQLTVTDVASLTGVTPGDRVTFELSGPSEISRITGREANAGTVTVFNDTDGTHSFQWTEQAHNAAGVLTQETGLADTGTYWVTVYDTANAADYVSYQNAYDAEGRLSQQDGKYDNGGTWRIDYDETNAEGWSSVRYEYDANGVRLSVAQTPDE